MRFKFDRDDLLPRLAWCARVVRGEQTALIRHGPWVETWETGFFEGAWTGPVAEGRPSQATACFGSGAEAATNGVRFVTPTHMHERINLVRVDEAVVVSNSLPFEQAEIGDDEEPS